MVVPLSDKDSTSTRVLLQHFLVIRMGQPVRRTILPIFASLARISASSVYANAHLLTYTHFSFRRSNKFRQVVDITPRLSAKVLSSPKPANAPAETDEQATSWTPQCNGNFSWRLEFMRSNFRFRPCLTRLWDAFDGFSLHIRLRESKFLAFRQSNCAETFERRAAADPN